MPNKAVITYQREFSFGVPPGRIWTAMEDVHAFEQWWPWLQDFHVDGAGLVAGARLSGVVAPPLPYRMRIVVDLVAVDPGAAIDATVGGDLSGPARLRVRPDGVGSV